MPPQRPKIKAVFFDFMGTCLDWHSSVLHSFPSSIQKSEASALALEWRRQYFLENSRRFHQGLEPEDIDETLARVLDSVLREQPGHISSHFDADVKNQMVGAWHSQRAWPEVGNALLALRNELGLEVFVHANGTTRLQLDLTASSGLNFNMLFSSQLLGFYKPSNDAYHKALQLVKLDPDEVVMVAAHAYDLRAARSIGMRTIYIHRWTDDINEDQTKLKSEFNIYLNCMEALPDVIAEM